MSDMFLLVPGLTAPRRVHELIYEGAELTGVSVEELFSATRLRKVARARWAVWWRLVRDETNGLRKRPSLLQVSRWFDKDHTTVRHGVLSWEQMHGRHGYVRLLSAAESNEEQTVEKNPDIMKTVALPVLMPAWAKWAAVSNTAVPGNMLEELLREADGLPLHEIVMRCDDMVNGRIEYRPDEDDHWATPMETALRKHGDCEDIALLKYALLRHLVRLQMGSVYVSIVYDLTARKHHALCVVYGRTTDEFFLLDVRGRRSPLRDLYVDNYNPVTTYSGGQMWVHGKRKLRA